MSINSLLREYKAARSVGALLGKNREEIQRDVNEILRKLAIALRAGAPTCMHGDEEVQWQKELKEVDDDILAMTAFFELSVDGYLRDPGALLTYYYASRIINNGSQLLDKTDAYYMRSIIIFKNMDCFQDLLSDIWTWRDSNNYSGSLSRREFFDLFLLANVYMAWDTETDNSTWNNIKRQTPMVASNHPTFSKQEVIKEGLHLSDIMYTYIKEFLNNSSLTVWEHRK